MYTLTQKFTFCFGHRLMGHPGKCKNVHGHTATADVRLDFSTLQANGMAIDFFEIKSKIGAWIDETLDHKLLLHDKDPLCEVFTKEGEVFQKVSFHPSAENIAQAIYDAAKELGLPVSTVTLWESEKSAATYGK